MQTATIPNLNPGETGYQTGGGNYFALSYAKKPFPRVGYIDLNMTMRVVDATGAAINDVDGKPIVIPQGIQIRSDNITATHTLTDEQKEWLATAEPLIDHEVAAQVHMAAVLG